MLEWPLSLITISNFLLHLAKAWVYGYTNNFSFEKLCFIWTTSEFCLLINVSQADPSEDSMTSRDIFLVSNKVINFCLFNRYNYSHTSCAGKLDFPCRSTNKENAISKDVLTFFSPGNHTDVSLHSCIETSIFPAPASWSPFLLLILSGWPTLSLSASALSNFTVPLNSPSTHQGKGMWGHSKKAAAYKWESELSQNPASRAPGLRLQPSELKENNPCLYLPVCCILLWQPELTKTLSSLNSLNKFEVHWRCPNPNIFFWSSVKMSNPKQIF